MYVRLVASDDKILGRFVGSTAQKALLFSLFQVGSSKKRVTRDASIIASARSTCVSSWKTMSHPKSPEMSWRSAPGTCTSPRRGRSRAWERTSMGSIVGKC